MTVWGNIILSRNHSLLFYAIFVFFASKNRLKTINPFDNDEFSIFDSQLEEKLNKLLKDNERTTNHLKEAEEEIERLKNEELRVSFAAC